MAYTRKMAGKVPVLKQDLVFDETPTPGSLNPVTSGGVAEAVGESSLNLAPEYSATATYPAGSYVIHDGVLYTNPNAINTAEDWNPAHWTQTTVAEMMANAAQKWTNRSVSLSIPGSHTESQDIQDHEVVHLSITRSSGSGHGILQLHLYGECYVFLDKGNLIDVTTYVGDGQSKPTINTVFGTPGFDASPESVLTAVTSGVPEEWDPADIDIIAVCGKYASITTNKPSLTSTSQQRVILHSLGDGTLFIIPEPV